ncbi:MAG: protease complex subunit PrcB family protein [Gemmatimonas sp.]
MSLLSRSVRLTVAVLVAGGAVSACASGGSAPAPAEGASVVSRPLPFDRLHIGPNSGYTRLSEFVIEDVDEFNRRWRGVQQGAPGTELPVIDFTRKTVVLLAIGSRNTGGHEVKIDSVNAVTDGAVVHYTVTSPGARCMSLQMLTSPIDVILLDKLGGHVRFSRKEVKGSC